MTTDVETAPPRPAVLGDNSATYGEALEQDPTILFRDADALAFLLASIEKQIEEFAPDIETDKGRKAIASLAYSIAKRKTTYDDAGASLTEEHRRQVKTIDEIRRRIRDALDALKLRARKPLDDWESAEEKRRHAINATRELFKQAAIIRADATLEGLAAMRRRVEEATVDEAFFGGYARDAIAERQTALDMIDATGARIEAANAERAELERLRSEEATRKRNEEAEARSKAAAEAEARRQQELKDAEARAAREAEERTREEARIAQEAEQVRRDEEATKVERQRQEEQRRKDDEAAAKLRTEQEARARAERETERLQRAEEQRQKDRAIREAAEIKAARNKQHRARIVREAREAIMAKTTIDNDTALILLKAVAANDIPHVSISFAAAVETVGK